MNPILDLKEYIPDVEAHVFSDGRLYLYGSMDICGRDEWCSRKYKVFSTDDMVHWTDHGVSFDTQAGQAGIFADSILYAPDCVEKDGKYYLYFCTAVSEGKGITNGEGVAVSDQPFGPFGEAVPIPFANGDGIDPAVFRDDDGEVYLYWGQHELRGAKLKKNMREIEEETLHKNMIDEDGFGFHEGSSMRKRNGIYYIIYADDSSGLPTRLSYVMGKTPFGPFDRKGIIIDNLGCDPWAWNNHGSIVEYNGQWYVFYHRQTRSSKYNRRVCVEPIYFNEDGSIRRVEMTTQGIDGPISPDTRMEAGRACQLGAGAYIEREGEEEYIRVVNDGDSAVFKYYNFDRAYHRFSVTLKGALREGNIEVRLDHEAGELLGCCRIFPGEEAERWSTFSCEISRAEGAHALCLVFRGSGKELYQVRDFSFQRKG